jgi:hypothetical protein
MPTGETMLKNPETKDLIARALKNAMGYREYADRVAGYVKRKATSGPSQTAEMVHYTLMNHQRMRRWERKIQLGEEHLKALESLDSPRIWLVLTESWCGDAAPVLPAIQALASNSPNLDLRIVFRDEHPELMDRFLTEGARSIPKLLSVDPGQGYRVTATWGPRPEAARRMLLEYRERHGKLTEEFRESLQKWYNKDGGESILAELTPLLALE